MGLVCDTSNGLGTLHNGIMYCNFHCSGYAFVSMILLKSFVKNGITFGITGFRYRNLTASGLSPRDFAATCPKNASTSVSDVFWNRKVVVGSRGGAFSSRSRSESTERGGGSTCTFQHGSQLGPEGKIGRLPTYLISF